MKNLVFTLLALFVFSVTHAQKEGKALIDSLLAELPTMNDDSNKVKILAKLSSNLQNYDLNLGVEYGEEALKLSRNLDYEFGIGISELSIARNYFQIGKIPEAIEHGHEAERIFLDLNDPDRLCATYLSLCAAYGRVDKPKSMEYYLLGRSLIYKGNDPIWKMGNLSWLYYLSQTRNRDSTEHYLTLWGEHFKHSTKKYHKASNFQMLAGNYEDRGQFDSAIFFYRLALPLFIELQSERHLGYTYQNMGHSMYWKESERGTPGVITREEAETYLNEAIRLGEKTGNILLISSSYNELYVLQKEQRETDKALATLEQVIVFTDSLQKVENEREITIQIWKSELELQEKELELLQLKNRQQLIGIVTGIVVVGILLVLVFAIHKNRRKIKKAYVLVNQQKEQVDALLIQLKDSNTKLESTNQELEAFSYSVSHDLRGPVRRVEALCDALQEDVKDKLDESELDLLKHIVDSTTLMNQLIEDMLKLSRITSHSMERSSCNLSEMVTKINQDLQLTYPDYKVNCEIRDNIVVQADHQLIQIALQNLLDNAWKYSSKVEHPKVTFGSMQQENKEVLFIRDNGVGFDMNQAEKLFAPFQRLHSDEEFKGTGIGLATVKRIIQKHGGTIWAESEPGKGTMFYFTL